MAAAKSASCATTMFFFDILYVPSDLYQLEVPSITIPTDSKKPAQDFAHVCVNTERAPHNLSQSIFTLQELFESASMDAAKKPNKLGCLGKNSNELMGYADEAMTEVLVGLKDGDRVVTVGQGGLKHGSRVRDLSATAAATDSTRVDNEENVEEMARR